MAGINLTKEELVILIKATNWACTEYFQKEGDSETIIKVSDINKKLNDELADRQRMYRRRYKPKG